MYFDANLLGIHQNGRFAKCWLAATNQKAFRAYFKREDVEDTQITNLCDEILATYKNKSHNPKKNLSLLTVAQLLFGTVSIYQQQVQFLYDKTKNLFSLNKYYISTPFKQLSESYNFFDKNNDDTRFGKKTRLNIKNDELLNETEDTRSEIITVAEINKLTKSFLNTSTKTEQNILSLNIPTQQISKNDDITIKEINWNKEIEIDLFDELTNEDTQHFIDIISGKKTLFDVCNNDAQKNKNEKIVQKNLSEVNNQENDTQTLQSIINTDENSTMDIIRAGDISNEITLDQIFLNNLPKEINNSTNDINNNTIIENISENLNEITMNQITPNNSMVLPSLPPEIDLYDELNNTQTTQLVDNNNIEIQKKATKRNLENVCNESNDGMCPQKRRKRTKKLKIDKLIELDSVTMKSQTTNYGNLRCINPIDDAITFYEYNFKNAKNLLNKPCIEINNQELLKNYMRKLVTKRKSIDTNMLSEILGLPTDENLDLNIDNIVEPPNKKTKRNHIQNLEQNIQIEAEQENLPLIQIIDNTIIEKENNFLGSNYNVELILKNVNDDFFKNIEDLNNNSHPEDTEAGLLLKKKIYSEWNLQAIIRKLFNFWNKEIYPIDMNVLCKNATKREAAVAFNSLLGALSAYQYIKITKNPDTNAIEHIEIGEKIIQKLN